MYRVFRKCQERTRLLDQPLGVTGVSEETCVSQVLRVSRNSPERK